MKLIYRVIRCIALTGEIIAGKEESPCIYWTGRNTLWEVINLAFSDHYPIYGIMHGLATHPNKHRAITMRSWNDKKKMISQLIWSKLHAPDRFFHRCGWHVFNPWLTTFLIKEETHSKTDAPLAWQYCSQTYENTRRTKYRKERKQPHYLRIGTSTSSFVAKSRQWTERLKIICSEKSSKKTEESPKPSGILYVKSCPPRTTALRSTR